MTWAPAVASRMVPNTILAISPDGRRVVYSARAEDDTALCGFDRSCPTTSDDCLEQMTACHPSGRPTAHRSDFLPIGRLKRLDLMRPVHARAMCVGSRANDVVRRSEPAWRDVGARRHNRVFASVWRAQTDLGQWRCVTSLARLRTRAKPTTYARIFSPARGSFSIESRLESAGTTRIT